MQCIVSYALHYIVRLLCTVVCSFSKTLKLYQKLTQLNIHKLLHSFLPIFLLFAVPASSILNTINPSVSVHYDTIRYDTILYDTTTIITDAYSLLLCPALPITHTYVLCYLPFPKRHILIAHNAQYNSYRIVN
jgi:hypothetical protein